MSCTSVPFTGESNRTAEPVNRGQAGEPLGRAHSTGGWLHIQHYFIQEQGFYWSWVLFVIGTGLAWMIMIITPK